MPVAFNRSVNGMSIITPVIVQTNYDGNVATFEERNYTITGVTRDSSGVALGSCVVKLFNSATDIVEQSTTSDGSGNYSFLVDKTKTWYVIAYKTGSPDVSGTTINTVAGT